MAFSTIILHLFFALVGLMGVILIADRKELIPHEGHVIHQDNARETPPISTCIYQVYAIRHEAVHDLEHATISDAANFATQDEKEAYNAGVSLFYEHLHDEPSHIPTIGDTNGKRPKMSCALCDDMTKDCRNACDRDPVSCLVWCTCQTWYWNEWCQWHCGYTCGKIG